MGIHLDCSKATTDAELELCVDKSLPVTRQEDIQVFGIGLTLGQFLVAYILFTVMLSVVIFNFTSNKKEK